MLAWRVHIAHTHFRSLFSRLHLDSNCCHIINQRLGLIFYLFISLCQWALECIKTMGFNHPLTLPQICISYHWFKWFNVNQLVQEFFDSQSKYPNTLWNHVGAITIVNLALLELHFVFSKYNWSIHLFWVLFYVNFAIRTWCWCRTLIHCLILFWGYMSIKLCAVRLDESILLCYIDRLYKL